MEDVKAIIEKVCKFKIGEIVRNRGSGYPRDGHGGVVIERGVIQLPGGDVSPVYAVRDSRLRGDPCGNPIQHEIELESAEAAKTN